MKFSLFVLVFISGCVSTRCVKYEMKETFDVKSEPKGPTIGSSIIFTESW